MYKNIKERANKFQSFFSNLLRQKKLEGFYLKIENEISIIKTELI